MHVIHVVAHPPFREGTGTACYYNAAVLQTLGCEVQIWAPRLGHIEPASLSVPYRFLRPYLSLGNAYLTPALLALPRVDLVHLHYPFIFGDMLTAMRAHILGIPLVLTYHNDLYGKGLRRPAFALYNRTVAPLILRQARKIAVVSLEHAASSFFAKTIFAYRQADLVEIGNGVDVDMFRPDFPCRPVRPRYGLSDEDFVLLFVSSLDASHSRKGLPLLLETLAELPDSRLKLLIVGDGDRRQEYEARAAALGLGRRVVFAGRVAHAGGAMTAHYAAADLVVIPSTMQESFGLALAQGMAMAKPVLGSDIPGVRTLIGECGLLIPPGDRRALANGILRLRADPVLRRELGEKARARILERYTWQHVGERLLAMYRQLLETA